MTFEQFRDACFRLALEKGCENAEVFSITGDSFSVNVLGGELDRYSVAKDNGGLNLRVIFAGKNGYAYTEILEDPESLVDRAIDNAKAFAALPPGIQARFQDIPGARTQATVLNHGRILAK